MKGVYEGLMLLRIPAYMWGTREEETIPCNCYRVSPGGGRGLRKNWASASLIPCPRSIRTKDRQDQFLPVEIDKKARWREVLDGDIIPLRNGTKFCG